jgi:hypothetical protein
MLPTQCRMQAGWPAAKAAGMGSGFASRSDGVPDPVPSTMRGRAGTRIPAQDGIINPPCPRVTLPAYPAPKPTATLALGDFLASLFLQ